MGRQSQKTRNPSRGPKKPAVMMKQHIAVPSFLGLSKSREVRAGHTLTRGESRRRSAASIRLESRDHILRDMGQLLMGARQTSLDRLERRPNGGVGTNAQGGLQILLGAVDFEHDLPALAGQLAAQGAQQFDLSFGELLPQFLPDAADFVGGHGSPPD